MARPARGAEGNRTPDLLDANESRYQLRHSPGARRPAGRDDLSSRSLARRTPVVRARPRVVEVVQVGVVVRRPRPATFPSGAGGGGAGLEAGQRRGRPRRGRGSGCRRVRSGSPVPGTRSGSSSRQVVAVVVLDVVVSGPSGSYVGGRPRPAGGRRGRGGPTRRARGPRAEDGAAGAGHAGGAALADRLLHAHLAAQVDEVADEGDVDGGVRPTTAPGTATAATTPVTTADDQQGQHDPLAERVARLRGERGGLAGRSRRGRGGSAAVGAPSLLARRACSSASSTAGPVVPRSSVPITSHLCSSRRPRPARGRRRGRSSTRPESAAMLGRATSCRCRATAGTRISSQITTRPAKIIELGTAASSPRRRGPGATRSPRPRSRPTINGSQPDARRTGQRRAVAAEVHS